MKAKKERVKIWMFQTNLSGNANGHFRFAELPVNSTEVTVREKFDYVYWKIWNVKCLGIFESEIGDKDFPSDTFLRKFRSNMTMIRSLKKRGKPNGRTRKRTR